MLGVQYPCDTPDNRAGVLPLNAPTVMIEDAARSKALATQRAVGRPASAWTTATARLTLMVVVGAFNTRATTGYYR
jgi:hypothetical protein